MTRRWIERLATPVTLVGALLLWSGAALLLKPDESGELVLLPGPTKVLGDLYTLVVEEGFTEDILVSVMRIVLGLLSSVVPAFILGIVLGIHPRLNTAMAPFFAFAKYVPPVAFIPVLILWLGVGLPQQLALLFIGTFFYLTVMVSTTVANTPTTFRDAARTLGVQRRQYVFKVVVRHGLPEFIEHLRTMVGIAWTYLVVVEMVAAQSGIGRVIINSQRYLQTGKVLAGVFTIGLLGVFSDQLLQLTGWILAPWKYDEPPLLARPIVLIGEMARNADRAPTTEGAS